VRVSGNGRAGATPETPFGQRLRALREGAGLTQEEPAAKAGLTAKAVSALERGERKRPYPHTVRSLTDTLGLSEEDSLSLLASVQKRGEPSPRRFGPGAARAADAASGEGPRARRDRGLPGRPGGHRLGRVRAGGRVLSGRARGHIRGLGQAERRLLPAGARGGGRSPRRPGPRRAAARGRGGAAGERRGPPNAMVDQDLHRRMAETTRGRLDDRAWEEAREVGRAMSFEEAVPFAFDGEDPPA
jgi:transcriptional regulator with XRE-family HTH domain